MQAEPAQRERLEIQKREGLIQERSSRGERRAVPGKSEVEAGLCLRTAEAVGGPCSGKDIYGILEPGSRETSRLVGNYPA